ncbi:50S ribosomal protein L35 [compost metagenome]|jgi:large subunit ribosomal protein L35|nr:50S ribosomal protein L35 [bacterium]
MPKMKTHKSSAKRFRVTGTGKVIRRKAFRKHLIVGKDGSRLRRISGEAIVSKEDAQRVKEALPYPQYLR